MARVGRKKTSKVEARRQAETRAGYLRVAGVLLAVLVVAGVYYTVQARHKALDPVTLCPAKPVSVTVLLVDVTDPMTPAQRQDFMNQLEGLKNSIPQYGKLTVTKVDATGDKLLSPVIVRCNPGTGQNENELTGAPAKVAALFAAKFAAPLDEAFKGLANASGADRSPILESVQSVALTELQKPAAKGAVKRLVVVSDLLQNTDGISFYNGLPDPEEFVKSKEFRKVQTDLREVSVDLWMLQRSDATATQPKALIDLWDRAISEQSGEVVHAYRVSG